MDETLMACLRVYQHLGSLVEHNDNCGNCAYMRITSEVAREILTNPAAYKDKLDQGLNGVDEEIDRRWEQTKYFRLWKEEHEAGRNPREAFEVRGWEP